MSILVGILAIAYAAFFGYFAYTNALPITQVKVIGTYQYVNEQDIQKTVNPFLAGKGLFAFPEWQAEQALEKLPGVQDASLWRIYPGTVKIILREKSAVARLENGELLATDGSHFMINNLPGAQNLPLLNGKIIYAKQMLAMYNSITPVFATANMNVTGLGLAENGDWSIQINQQFWIILGKRHLHQANNCVQLTFAMFMALQHHGNKHRPMHLIADQPEQPYVMQLAKCAGAPVLCAPSDN
jgi:cell division protein FtsQ